MTCDQEQYHGNPFRYCAICGWMEDDFEMFRVGDKVKKPKGYPFVGIVRAVFKNSAGHTRLVVELDRGLKGDMMHIFQPSQLESWGPRGDDPGIMKTQTKEG